MTSLPSPATLWSSSQPAGSSDPAARSRVFWARPLVPILPLQRDEPFWLDLPSFPSPPLEDAEAQRPLDISTRDSAHHGDTRHEGHAASAPRGTAPAGAKPSQSVEHPQAGRESSVRAGEGSGKVQELPSSSTHQEQKQERRRSQNDAGPAFAEATEPRLAVLAKKALAQPLAPEEAQEVSALLKAEGGLGLLCSRISSSSLKDLVNHNPDVATEILRGLVASFSKAYFAYADALVDMELSLNSLEVVSALVKALGDPSDFVVKFISRGIRMCQETKDKYAQNRQVRFLCMFIQAQLKAKTIHVQDIFVEVQVFCIEFSRFKEASSLFKLLKALDNA